MCTHTLIKARKNTIFTPKIEKEGKIDEFPKPKTLTEEIEAKIKAEEEEIQRAIPDAEEEPADEEPAELTDEEKREIYINALKQSKIRFRPIKNGVKVTTVVVTDERLGRKHKVKTREAQTNVTVNQFGADYRKKRQRKNKMAKASRKVNR